MLFAASHIAVKSVTMCEEDFYVACEEQGSRPIEFKRRVEILPRSEV